MTSVLIDPALKPAVIFDGTLDLLGGNTYEGGSFIITAQGDDATWGNPQPIDVYLETQLQDGAVVFTQGHGNRDLFLRLRVRADDAAGLQAGEAALVAACGKRTTLEWTPPDGLAATSVFKIYTAHLDHVLDGDQERARTRTYGLRLTASPFVQSVDLITLDAVPDGVSFSETVIDECTSTTNWTAKYTLSLVSGQAVRSSVTLPAGRPAPNATNWLKRTASVTITDTYVRLKGSTTSGDLTLVVDDVTYEPVAISGSYMWFEVPAGTYSTIEVIASADFTPTGTDWKVTVWSLYQTNTAGFGSARELQRGFTDIRGTVRAPGELTISHDTDPLGEVLAYIFPTGLGDYSPPLQPYRTDGGSISPDSSLVSGGREPIDGTPTTWVIPSGSLPPGAYHFLAHLRHTTAAGTYPLTYTAEVAGTTITRTVNVTLDATNTWQIISIGTQHLPPLRVKGDSDRDVTITLAGPANMQLDTAWLFFADEYDTPTALIHVDAGSELTMSYQTPTPDIPTTLVYIGDHSAGVNVKAASDPEFKPPRVNLYLVTTGAENAEAQLSYYPHWHTHAGQ